MALVLVLRNARYLPRSIRRRLAYAWTFAFHRCTLPLVERGLEERIDLARWLGLVSRVTRGRLEVAPHARLEPLPLAHA